MALSLVLLGATLALQAPPRIPEAAIDSLIRSRMAERRIPGVAVGIAWNGQTVFQRSWGLANVETGTPLSDESVFELASITKQMTAVAVMMLVEDGRLRLDDSITAWIDSTPAAWRGITVRHLLTHQAGINGPSVPIVDGSPLLRITTRQAFNAAAALRTTFPPGTDALYSDEGYFLLGMIIERASGMRYAEFLQQRIFGPLQMTRTSVLDRRRVLPGRVATYEMQQGVLVNWRRDWQHELPAFFGVWSTLGDLLKWDAALRSGTLLARASLEQMWTPARVAGGRTALVSGRPYGFGYEVSDLRGQRFVAHSGASGTFLLHFLDEPLTIAVLGNLSNTAGPNATLLSREIAGLLRPHYQPAHRLTPAARDPNPARTDTIRSVLLALASGEVTPPMTAGFRGWVEAMPRGFRSRWFARLAALGPLEFLACDEVAGRGVALLDPVERICYWRARSGPETLYFAAWLAAGGGVSYLRFGRSDEL